jgi:hypothetical protein
MMVPLELEFIKDHCLEKPTEAKLRHKNSIHLKINKLDSFTMIR